jgi:hypothetical protein
MFTVAGRGWFVCCASTLGSLDMGLEESEARESLGGDKLKAGKSMFRVGDSRAGMYIVSVHELCMRMSLLRTVWPAM